jgi:hypothetical protein
MIETWILSKIEPLKRASLLILRDPQRLIQRGDLVVDGWAEENGFAVLFCTGNLGLRDMYEPIRGDSDARVLVVDRSRLDAKNPLFYPDLEALAGPRHKLTLSLRDFLVEQSGDPHWPRLVDERQLSGLILDNLRATLRAHAQLRQVSESRFTDSDLYKIVLGAALKINPFRQLSATEIRRLCIEGHHALQEVRRVLPPDVMETLRQAIARAPRPFCWLLERDPDLIVRAFTLAAIMRQHGLEHQLLLSNLDPALHGYREITPDFLDQALEEQLAADPAGVVADVADSDGFLLDDPERLAFLLRDRLALDDPQRAFEALERERLSPLIRGMALISLLADLIQHKKAKFHREVLALLDRQNQEAHLPATRRPTAQWQALESAYRRAVEVYRLTGRLSRYARKFRVTPAEDLSFEEFDRLWNEERLNRLDYYVSDLERTLRVKDILPAPRKAFWPELAARWEAARQELKRVVQSIGEMQNLVDARFQDLYRLHYTRWIQQPDAPVVFTHQFLARVLGAHWDPQSGRKAVVLVFDGLRTDAWDELLRPVFEERFELIESRPGSALLPTETHLSRKAISAGCLPQDFTARSELDLLRAWLQRGLRLNPRFEVVKDDDTVKSGMTVRYVSQQLEYIVFNFSDQNLHHNTSELALIYDSTVGTIIREDVRSVLRELPDDALLFITSDHGFVPVPKPTVTIPDAIVADTHDIKYRNARATGRLQGEKRVIAFDARVMGISPFSETRTQKPPHSVLFPRPGFTLRRPRGRHTPDRYTHGGLSLAECLVPMVVMGPRRGGQAALVIENVRQVGAAREDESLALEITVVARQVGLPGLALSLSFSRDEIPPRREVLRGARATYTVRWRPRLDDISAADRRQGEVVQAVTVILSYRDPSRGESVRLSHTADVRVKLDTTRLRRRVDSKLDLLMGKVPQGLKG